MNTVIYDTPVKAAGFVVPVPSAERIPRTESSVPFNACDRQGDPIDLKEYGYAEEEFFVSGEANVYSMGPSVEDPTYIKASGCPYTDRILVRRPENRRNFSGTVLVELMNYAFFIDNPEAGWGAMHEYLMERGDAWVGITIRDCCIASLKKYDEKRYARLAIPNPVPPKKRHDVGRAYGFKIDPDCENGLFFDIISQVGALIRAEAEGTPFEGMDVRYLYVTGASAGDLTTYAGYVHNYAKLPDGNPVYDGIQIYMTGAPCNLNNEEMNVLAPDPLGIIYPCVPTFRVLTMGDMLGKGTHPDWSLMQRREESDSPVYRIYETAGATLGIRADRDIMMNRGDVERCGGRWVDKRPRLPRHAFPMQFVIRACFDALKKYCESGILPPPSQLLEFTGEYPDVEFKVDDNGNAEGGIRTSYTDVPIAEYQWDGKIIPFTKEQLREKYTSHDQYVRMVAESCADCVNKGFMLPKDALSVIQDAVAFNLDDDGFLDGILGVVGESTYGM